jgi:voltage-gated potassium channel
MAIGVYLTERYNDDSNIKTWSDAFWFPLITLTTIGYGDRFPVTNQGRAITGVGIIFGLGLMATVLSELPQIAIERAEKKEKGLGQVKFQGHAIVCNWHPEIGPVLIKELLEGETAVQDIVIISSGERPREDNHHVRWVCGNPSKEEILQQANINKAAVVVALPTQEEVLRESEVADSLSLMLLTTVQEIAEKNNRHVWRQVSLQREENRKHFVELEVDTIVNFNQIGAKVLAMAYEDRGSDEVINELLSHDSGCTLYTTRIPIILSGKMFKELYKHPHWIPIALMRQGKVMVNPDKITILESNDEVIVVAPSRPII